MSCFEHWMKNPGEEFTFQLTDDQNLLACVGRLRTTGPGTGQSSDFSLDDLRQGVAWNLEDGMTYTLRLLVQPQQDGNVQIQVETSFGGPQACDCDGAGVIGTWLIDVI